MDSTILYQKSEQLLPWNVKHIIFNSSIIPYWTDKSVYYFKETVNDKILIQIDLNTKKKKYIISFTKILKTLSSEKKIDVIKQLITDFEIKEDSELLFYFNYNEHYWCFNPKKNSCEIVNIIQTEQLISPNKKWALQRKNYNLYLICLADRQSFQLTYDGEVYYDYASSPETNTQAITLKLKNHILKPIAIWSPNSKKIITHKLDQRKVKELFLLQNAPPNEQRPKIHKYRMSFSGDENLPLAELLIIDVENKTVIPIKTAALLSPYLTAIEFNWLWWNADNTRAYFLRETRGSKKIFLTEIDVETGDTKILIVEHAKSTYVEPSPHAPWEVQVYILKNNQQIIWLSERSGYAHLYLFHVGKKYPQIITQGEWTVKKIHFFDEECNWLYFTACGYDKNTDPYYEYLYKCRLDGNELQCLTPINAHHILQISKNRKFYIDTFSTINNAPITFLYDLKENKSTLVEKSNINGLIKLNWIPPRRLHEKARDGKTNIYGNLYFPSHFNSSKRYPIIDFIYPGPQIYSTPTHFNIYEALSCSSWIAQALAELGFIVLQIDGFGTPGRSKAFHDATYKNIGDCGIPDHVAAIKQLALKYDFIDLEKIGITGFSAGGYASVRAMLLYPEFFKVCVSTAGNHDLRNYPASYGEKYHSLDRDSYSAQSNVSDAQKLQGKLLLIHGEMDDNVHPCATMQLVDALIKYNKDFELLIMPNL